MEVVKKNIVSISLGILALLAVASLFWPISGFYASLDTIMQDHVKVATQLDSLARKQRTKPLLSPDSPTGEPLEVYPSEKVIDAGTEATDKVHTEAQSMVDRANQVSSQHVLLLTGEIPKPVDQVRYDFAAKYAAEVTDLVRWRTKLDAVTPPTQAEVTAEETKKQAEINTNQLVMGTDGITPTPDSQAEANLEFANQKPLIRPKMEQDRAEEHRMYMLPNTLPVLTDVDVHHPPPTPDRIADAQILMWVVDDVADSIARANDQYSDPDVAGGPPVKNILHTPVKQLDKITSPRPLLLSTGVDLNAGVTTLAPKVVSASPTGRVCNGLYDVLEFKIDLVVDAAKLPLVIRELEIGEFITVLNTQITDVVDPAITASTNLGGFRYGNKPVISVELDCEELFLKSFTNDLMPDSHKKGLGGNNLQNASQPVAPIIDPTAVFDPNAQQQQ